MTIMINTHTAIQDLEAAGADTKLAEAIVKTVSQADAQLATKADLTALRADLQATIVSLKRRLIGYLIAAVLIVLAAIKYL